MASNEDFMAYLTGRGMSFKNYAAGTRKYGPTGRSAPNVGASNKAGYKLRDRKAKSKRNAMLKRMQAGQRGRYMSKDYQNPNGRSF